MKILAHLLFQSDSDPSSTEVRQGQEASDNNLILVSSGKKQFIRSKINAFIILINVIINSIGLHEIYTSQGCMTSK